MADIFISYKKEDAGRVVRIVEGLRTEGFSVWWDHGIAPGAQWDQTIQHQLSVAKVVIAVWSEASVNAPWVKEEAGVGKSRGILLPVRIDNVEPPLGFGLIQAADLRGWDGDPKDAHFQHFLGAVGAVLKGERPAGLEAPRARKRAPMGLYAAVGAVLAALIAAAAFVVLRGEGEVASRAGADGSEAAIVLDGANPAAPPTAHGAPPANPSAPVATSAPARPAPAPVGVDPRDEATFNQAREVRTRQAFQNYLIAYPTGAYADRVRDILLTCRSETQETWEPGGSAQPVRGVSVQSGQTQAQACAEATTMARRQADVNCRAITGNVGFRNGAPTVQDATCDCREQTYGWACTIDMPARCDWEQRMQRQVELCG